MPLFLTQQADLVVDAGAIVDRTVGVEIVEKWEPDTIATTLGKHHALLEVQN